MDTTSNGNGNGKNPRGRPAISPGEPSEPVSVRFPVSTFDWLDTYAKAHHISKAELIRGLPAIAMRMEARITALQAEVDRLINHNVQTATNEEKSLVFVQLLACKALAEGNTVAAAEMFLQRAPENFYAPYVRRTLELFHQANAKNPGSVSDEDLWRRLT